MDHTRHGRQQLQWNGHPREFCLYGEHLNVCDTNPDGHSAVAAYWLQSSPNTTRYAWNPNGSGTCKDFNLDLPEDTWIEYIACIGEYGPRQILSCPGALVLDWA